MEMTGISVLVLNVKSAMEIKYYDYYSGAVPRPVTSAQFSVHHAACWFQGRQDADRTQDTDNTDRTHPVT